MTTVLEATPPRFSVQEAAAIAAEVFGVEGAAADLGSERDQTFGIGDAAILKISNSGEDPAALDLEAQAIAHIARVDAGLPVARLLEATTARGHHVRLFERMPGRSASAPALSDDALRAYGVMQARLTRALRGFFHPAAGRELLWDVQHAPKLRALLPSIADTGRRGLAEAVIDRFDARVAPAWPTLPAQVVHGDFTLDNVLMDDRGYVTGIVDFGDMGHSAPAADLAIGLVSLIRGRPPQDVFRSARIAIDGYQSQIPLEPAELAVLGDLVAARLVALVTISAWRVERYPENAEYIQAWDAGSWELIEQFAELGADTVGRELGAPAVPQPTEKLATRRNRVLGPALTKLTYARPVHVVRAEGVWLHDASGERLLDAYNNVPVVGHCHPRVTEAVVRQTRAVNTHSRYLYEPLVELAERLVATTPEGSGLDTVALVNSGTEANDLAWRIATTVTGNERALITDFAYHGVSEAIADLSPEEWPAGHRPAHVQTRPPDRLAEPIGTGLAATYIDCGFTSDGILTPPAADLAALVDHTHAAGGLFVADEVQAGHGRTGRHLWSFAATGITPDLVTLGKPMGNGYPVAAVITRSDLMQRFAQTTSFFSTFGGNPVAAAAALAVLDVIEDERLVERAGATGDRLTAALRDRGLTVRGQGLLIGVEHDDARRVVDAMRDRGVLIGVTGPSADVLKIRPPLAFTDEHADLLLAALDAAL